MKTPTTQPLSLPVRLTRSLRTPFWKKTVSSVLLAQFALWSVQVKGANVNWTGALPGNWDTATSNWSAGTWNNAGLDTAIFGAPSGVVTLAEAITAGGLTFNTSGYNIAGGNTLTLTPPSGFASPLLTVNNNGLGTNRATISASLAGISGFTKTGNGTLVLSGANTGLSGDVAIKGGNVVITNANQLGSSTGTAISVTGAANTTGAAGGTGFTGGALVLQGSSVSASSTAGITLNRELSLAGRGPGANNATGALVSIGYNTLAGGLTIASPATESRAWASHGTTTVSGPVFLGTGAAQGFWGNGNWNISGQVSGLDAANDRLFKTGTLIGSTMWLQNANNNFLQSLRIDSGTVRVQTNSALGLNSGTQAVDLNNGTLEVRSDSFAGFSTRNVFVRDGVTGTIFVDHDLTGSLGVGSLSNYQNQTVTFNTLRTTGTNSNTVFASRNGWALTFNALAAGGGNNSPSITNNATGLVTLTGTTLWGQTDGTARTLTITGGGDTTYNGRITASGAAHLMTKTGSGTLTLSQAQAGTASTFTGNYNVNDGTTAIRTIDVLNSTSASAGRVVFGGGALSFLGNSGTGAGETWTNKILDFNNANNYLLANQSGSAPTALILPNNFAVSSNAAKTLHLGGSAPTSVVNQITGLITNGGNLTNINKIGTSTWEIAAPTSYGTAATLSLAATGAAATTTVTLASGTTGSLVVGQPISGVGIPFGTTIAQIRDSTTIILSGNRAASSAADPAVSVGVASGITSTITNTVASTGTANPVITVASTANLVPGQKVTSTNLPASQNWYIRDITSGTTVTLVSGTGASLVAGAVAASEVITPQASPNFGGNLTIANGTLRANAATATSDIINSTSNLIFNIDSVTLMGNAGGTFNYVGFAGGNSTEVLGRLIPTAGQGVVSITNGTGNDTLTFLDIGTRGAGATLNYQPGTGTINFNGTAPAGSNGIQSGYATFNGLDWVNSGATASQFTGYTAGSGALTLAAATNFSIAGAASTAALGTINSLKLTGGAALTLGGQLSFTTNPGGVLFDNSGGTASITGSTLGTAAQELVVTTNGSSPAVAPAPGAALTTGNALTISSTQPGGASLTKTGTGTLIFTGPRTYTGNTVINQGAIQMSGATADLGVLTTAGNQTAIRQGAILDVNAAGASTALYTGGPSFAQISIGALTGTGLITNSGAGGTTQSTISLGGTATTGTTTFGGTLQNGTGILNVVINGTAARSQAILGAQPYTGVTVINTGNLAVTTLADGGTASGLGASSNAASNLIFNAGTLTYTGAAAAGATTGGGIYQTTQTPSVSTDRLFSLAGNATIQSSGTFGNEAASGGTGQNNASLIWSNTGDIAFVTSGAKTLTLGGNSIGDNMFRPKITDNTVGGAATAVTKADAGLWILNPSTSNTYTGLTTVSGGALRVANAAASVQGLSANSPLVLNGGVLETATSFTRTLGAAVAGTGNVSLTGGASGFAASTTDRLVVTIGGGAITWGGATFNPTALVLGSSTALGETEITNNIDIGAATRTITVNNNGNTGTMVTAGILSGVISGPGTGGNALIKNGGGPLILGNANTYTGSTRVDAGNLIVTSIGTGTSSSLGASGALITNAGDTDLNPIFYVGSGETANRNLTLQASANYTATRNIRIDSSGSGALVWNTGTFAHTTRGDTVARALILDLRGSNTDNNQMNLVLTDSTNATFPNPLNLTKSDGGTWVLNPASANTFTGAITASGGNLGLTTNGIGAASQINLGNGAIFAFGGALTTNKLVQLNNNASALFGGQNAITINANVQKQAGANDQTISNNLEGGALLTINGNYVNLENATAISTRTLNVRGYGSTVWNGVIPDNANVATSVGVGGSRTALNIAIDPNASLTLTGSSANTYTGPTTLTDGILIVDKVAAFGAAAFGGTAVFALNGGTLRVGSSLANLTGANAITNAVQINGSPAKVDGSKSIEFSGGVTLGASRTLQNELTGGANLIISGLGITNSAASTLTLFGAGNTLISGAYNAGTGANGLTLSGTGALSLTGTNLATGALTVSRGTITLSGTSGGSWNAGTVQVNSGGTLTLDNSGGNNAAGRLFDTGAFTGNGGTLNFINNGTSSSETIGALTLNSATTRITMSGAGTGTLTFASIATPNTGSTLDLSTISGLGTTNQVIFTAVPTLTNGINTRILINGGADFATHTGGSIGAYASYNNGNNLNTAAATDTLNLTASAATTANRTVNALKLNGTGLAVTGAAANRLTLTAAGILNTGGNNALSINEVAFTTTAVLQVAPTTTLTVNSDLSGSLGFTKVLGGDLTFGTGARSFITSTHNLLGGTTTLNGGADTFFPNQALILNDGATLNLNGGGQYINTLNSTGALPGTGGTINGGGALVINNGGTFGGVITSGTSFGRVQGSTLAFQSAQSYTGTTLLMGGTTTFENDATLLNTSDISINHATLSLSNNTGLQTQNNNRVGDAIAISLRGGTISVTGRLTTAATETLGAVSALQGANTITATTGGGTITSMDLALASLSRSAGTTVNFTGTNLGQQGNSARITYGSGPAAVGGGVLGAWAIANTTDYAAYNAGQGVGVVGQGGFVGYDAQVIAAANVAPISGTFATGNITNIVSTAASSILLGAGTTTTGLLRIGGAFTTDVNFTNNADTLNLGLGGILRSNDNFATSIGSVASRGIITSGTSELVVYNAANTTGATVMTINSSIQGAGTALVKSGGGVLALTGVNTYGGGTTVAQGTLELRGTTTGDVVIPAGGLSLINSTVTQFVTAGTNPTGQGQINATNAVTLRGGSTLTLTGANTLSSLAFDNNGGTATPTVTSGGLLTLTNATPITVTSSNPSTVATIAGNIDVGSGTKTINTPAIQVGGVTVTNIVPALSITANILSPGATINKTGNGLLQLGGQSTFTGGVNLNAGGLVIGASSTPTSGGSGITSGPLGSGALSVASGAYLFSNSTASVGNNVVFAGAPRFDSTANTAWTLTLNGSLTGAGLASPNPTIEIANPGLTVALLGNIPNIGTITSFSKTGLGTLIFNSTGYTGNYDANALGNGLAVSLLHDGTSPNIGNGVVETISLGSLTFDPVGTGTVTVGRAGGSLPFNQAQNKIIAPSSINTVLTNGLTVANNNGYGLQVSDSGALVGTPTFTVNTASVSNITQGLTLSGALNGTGFIKAGPGALVLGNAGNTFIGDITINQGVVSAAGNAQLGNAANVIKLAAAVAGTAALRATGTFSLANPLQLVGTANTRAIEVTGTNTLTLTNAFDLNAGAGAAASLAKQDTGTLLINADNSATPWNGVLTISQGAVSLGNALGLGTTTGNTIVAASGAALQLPAGISLGEPLTLNGTGLFTAGALQGTGSGTSIQTGAITLAAAAAIGADAGNTLSIRGGASGAFALTLAGAGNTEFTTTAVPVGLTNMTKIGSGTSTMGVASPAYVGTITVNRGTFQLGSAGVGSVGATGLITVNQNGVFTIDNTSSAASRTAARPMTLAGGTFNYNTNTASPFADVNGAAAILTLNSGANSIVMTNAGASTTTLTMGSLAFGSGSTGNITGLSLTSNLLKFGTTTPTLTPATTGLFSRLTVTDSTNGNEFATYNGLLAAGNGVVPFTAYAPATNILSAGATQTYKATSATSNSLTGNQTLNALNLQTTGGTPNVGGLGGLNPTTLTLTSGAILVNGTGTNAILSVPIIALGGAEGVIHTSSGKTLDVSSGFSGTAGMTKALNGTLNLNAQQFVSGTTTVNGGTLSLQSAATNTLLFNNNLTVNTGGTVDLKNGAQFIQNLASQGAAANTDIGGGIVTNSGAQATLVTNSNSGFGGTIQGTIYLNKTGTNGLTLTNPNSFAGDTLITGGTLTLVDSGTLGTPGTGNIGINFGSLTLTNTGLLDNADRVSLATITMKGGNVSFNGRAQTNSTEALGAVILADGFNTIFNTAGGTGINSSVLTLDSITRSVGSTATLRLNNNGVLGTLGSVANIRISGAAPTLTNNIVGPWAMSDREFLSYDSTYGFGGLNAVGFANYAGSGLNTSPLATDNVRQAFAGGTTTLAANTVVNTLNISQTATSILDLGTNTLRVQGGGMIIAVNTDATSMTINNGTITSGTVGAASDFYLHVTPFSNNTRTTVIGAAIADNAPGTGPVRLIVTIPDNNAASTLTLSGTNTYTGGTIINQGPVVLGATGTLGTGGITVNGPGSLTQTLAGVIPSSNTLTLGGSSTVTLANQANSLAGLVINNLGGSAPTLTPTGTLTLTGGTTVSTVNAGAVATIGTGTLDLNAAGAYSINVGATVVNGQDVAPWQAGLIINSVIQNGGISKSGAGVLQLGGASTFAGGVNITAGGLIIASDTNSLLLNDPVVTGPVGTGTLTMGANTTLLAGGAARTITNNVTFLGDSVFNGTNNLTLNGTTTLPSIWNATVTAPQMTVTIGDATPSIVTDEINKSGLGTLVVGNYAGTINATGGLLFTGDGNTLSTLQSIALGGALVIAGDTALTVNRSGGAPNARNKTLQKASLSNAGSILSVNNLSGYGLEITGGTSLTAASHFAVGVATASNVIQGLTLSGVVSDTGGFNLVKSGAGTLALTNAGNTFGGVGTTIDVLAGVLAANSDGALGNSNNSITLNVDGSTGVGFRATGTFSTARSFILNQANNAFEVTAGNVLTLSNAFSWPVATNTLAKNDNGVLAITADNTGWNGAVAINAGAIRVGHANALGAGAVTVNNSVGSALQLDGVSFGSPVTLFSTGASGINSAGVIQATSGTSTLTGTITQTTGSAVTIGADAGATLNINGTFATSNSTTFNVGSGGVINLNTAYGNGGTGGPTFAKFGAGTLNVTVNQPAVTSAINVNQGTLNVSGSGVTLGLTGLVSVNASGTLTLNDAAATAARLGNRAVTIQGGTVNYLGSTSTESSTGALTFARMGGIYNQTASTSATVTFASLALGADATANFTGSGLGTASNRLLFTTAPTLVPATTGILARATVNGADFATYGANGLAAFTAYQNSNNPNTAAATDTMNLTANAALTANRTLNSVKISGGTPVTLSGAAFNQLTLTAGGVLATGATTHIMSVPVLANAAVQDIFHVDSGSTLNVTSTLTGTAGLVKDGAGTLTIGSPASNSGIANVNANTLSGNLTVARGTLTLNGGTNTYAPGQFLVMGGPAATLDLNGTSQQISGLLTDTATPGSGGSIIGTAGSQLVINQDNNARTFAGSIGGAVNLVRSGQNTLTLVSPNTYTGTTLINGNTTILQSGATLSGTSAVDLNYATLTLDNSGLNDSTDRINDAASIALRGSTLTLTGRAQTASSEVLGAVSIAQGFNVINSNAGGTGVNSADLSLASLSRPGGSSATFFANGTNLGTIGSNGRITVTTLNGVATTNPAYSANGSGLTNNLVGGWAISNNDFLTYIPGLGLAPLNQTGAAQYDLTNTFVGGVSTDNVRLTANTTVPNGGSTVNAVSMTGSAINIAFATGTDTLNITSGGLIGPNNNQTIGATLDSGRITAGGLTPAANSDLYVYNRANTLTINSRIIDNVNGSAVRSVFTASGGTITLVNPNNSYTGGTVLNGGTLNLTNTAATAVIPAGGLTINGGTVTMNNFAGQINAANVVTLNGAGSTLNLWGDNTLAGLVLNNNGGGSGNLQINTFSQVATAGAAASGVLTIGASGIVATSSNIASNSYIIGRTDFGATNKTIQVDAVSANSVDINPLFAGLNIQGIVGSTGGFTKTGAGVLALQAQAHYTGPTTVTNGTLRVSVTNAGSRLSALTLGAGTYLNLANASTTWGSLAGSGTIFASAGTPTLTVGFNNDATTTFSGQLARFNDAVINGISLQKVGTGELVMTSAQSFATGTTGTITVNGGSLRYRDTGAAFPGTAASGATTLTVNNGGTLALDNTGTTSVNNRLGLNAIGTLNLQGGRLAINAGSTAATPVTELVTTFNVTNGGGRIELTPDAVNPVTLTVTTLNTANGNGSLVVGGIDGSVAGTAGKAALVITTPNLLGGQGGGANGTTTMSVRHDILGDASVSGLGTGFLVRDTAVGGTYRALASGELASAFALPLTTDVDLVTAGNQAAGALNVGLTGSAATIGVNTVANTLTISGTSSIGSSLGAAFGNYGPGGNLLTTSLSNAAASLTLAGATGTINTAFGSTTTGTTPFAHVIAGGTLNVNGAFGFSNAGTTGTAGLAKADGGTMNLNNKAYYTGTTSVNNGTLNLNSGSANTLAVVPTTGGATVSQLNLNGTSATVDLKGQNQAFGTLTSVNPLPGQGGTLTNTGAAATLSISTQAASGTFGGSITGAIALTRSGANTTTLTNANTYTGATIVRGGTLQLRDSGTISSTAGLTLNYGTLNWDNFGLNAAGTPNPTRIAATNPVTLQGGTFTINGAGSTDTVLTLNSVTVTGGNNIINVLPYINEGSTVKLTIGNLVRNVNNRSGVVFNGFTTNNSTGASVLGGQGLTQNGNIILNQINGTNFTASNLVNNLIGGWAVADGSTFATYVNGFGVSVMGQTTQGIVAPGFTGTDVSAALVATGNYNDGTTARTLAAGAVTANSLRFGPGANQTITFPATTTLSLGTGIITNAGFSTTLAATDASNTLTGTGTDLYFYINQNTVAVQPAIVGTAALVSNGPATLSLRPTFASNTYSGGTFVNAGTLNLQAGGAFTVIPGDLTINNAAVTMSVGQVNQIAATSNVFINGGGSLTFPNYSTGPTQTLASLTFTNDGGTGNPSLTLGTPTVATSTLILSSATPITSTNNSLATTPTISTGAATLTALQFSNANPVLTVNDGLAETELAISAPITQNVSMLSLSKTGTGVLALSGASTFSTGFNLNQGGLMFGANSTGGPVTSGPVGTGTLTIAGGTSLLSDNTIRTIGNATTVSGDFTFAGPVAGNGVILSGAMALGATGRTITVTSPAVTSTISGAMTSTATGTALTKAGAGTLVLSSATNSFGGAGVAVTGGILKNGIENAIPTGSAVAVSAGAGYDLNNFNQTLDGISGAGFITQSAGNTRTLTISSTVTNSTFNSVITDNNLGLANSRLNLTKVGTPTTLTLGGANSYIGTTTVTSGILSITNALALGTTANGTLVSSGGSLELQNNITVTGEALSIAGTGSATNGALRNLSGNNTFAGAVTLTGAASIQSDAGSLTLDVPSGNAITATNQNLTFTGAGNTTVADAIAIGSGSLTKTGSGSLTLGAINTYSGKTTIANGTISVGSIDALGTNAALDLGVATTSSGRLLYTGGVTTLTKDINALGNGTDTIQNAGSGLLTLSGTLTKAGTTLNLVGGASGILVTGTIVGLPASSDLVIGTGITTLQNANTYNGPTILNSGGTLNINHASAISTGPLTINGGTIDNTSGAAITLSTNNPLNINANFTFTGSNNLNLGTGAVTLDANRTVTVTANTLTIGGPIGGAFSLTGTGAGTLLLTGASTYTGTTTAVAGSTISVGGNGSLGDTSSGTVINSGASLALNNVLYTDAEPLNINGAGVGSGGAFITTGTSSFAGTITATTNATINATGTLSLTGGLVKNGTTLTLGGTGTYNISGAGISGASANSDLVVDASTVNLDVASTYNGPTFIRNGGRINANVASALPTSTARTAIIMDDSGSGSSTLGLAVNQSVASLTGAATSQILLGASELTVGASGSGSSVFAGSIAGTGGSIVKDGTNTQTFSGANTYTGTTTLNAGTLNLGSAENAGVSGPLGNGGSIVFGGGTLQYSASNQNDYSGRFSTAASQAIRIDTNSQNVTLATALTSSGGSLNKQGAGTLTVTAANTFDAGTTVNGGTLLVNNTTGSGTGSGAVSVSNAGTVLGGNGTIAGDLTVNAGALIAPGSAASTAGTLTIGGSTVVIAGNGVAETRVNFDYTTATGNVPGLTASTWSSYSGALLTGNGGQSNDLLNFTATTTSLSWNTGGKINLNQIGSAYSWIQGDVFNLLDWTALGDSGNGAGSIGGSFNSAIDFNLPILSGGLAWDTSRFVTTGAIAVIPEPSRALLMLFGLMALFFRRRRQD